MDLTKKIKVAVLATGITLALAGAATATMHAVTKDSAFCGTCHVMDNYMGSWSHSSHREVAGCNDCHTDQRNYLAKTYSKATAGARHAYVNIIGPPDHLKMIPSSKEVTQRNCLRCHDDLVEKTRLAESDGNYCFDCHRSTPHGRERPST
ncbi:NapC/NirT family cytochrome c [Heliophilum fasciatum]|uniref:Respiratory nitrite reductase-specific menaquinol--cytochrome-c reductase (NrfH) n=1 Tax=Heliophilum fasciatum TaxID=35700 RepID=A0A4R2RPJ0_9FIRM|nr:NapC/NirT family cytochrome c [Heliophilum fasciatum]MCW2277567.1 cytochrome c nitrite reductase small subunit [Heliophilum fasciatum]TCP65143.1 respiratory nitrite reductase-specific menaquinol--cytochrome-c reductase (NrfH) precursor [Heliophilum fasciatum]